MRNYQLLLSAFLAASMGVAGAQQQGINRMSVDGVEFPAAAPRKVNADLPIIHNSLGALPEEVSTQTYSGHSRDKALATGITVGKDDWFTFKKFAADIVRYSLTDGRVSSIDLYYPGVAEGLSYSAEHRISGQFGEPMYEGIALVWRPTVDGVPVSIRLTYQDKNLHLSYHIAPVDWYLLYHEVAGPIADAMRAGRLARGMTLEQARLVLGEPSSTAGEGTVVCTWLWKSTKTGRDGTAQSPEPQRVVTATFVNDALDTFTDTNPPKPPGGEKSPPTPPAKTPGGGKSPPKKKR